MEITSEEIIIFRRQFNLTQEKLAELLGVSERTIQNYESGSKIPKSKNVIFSNLFKSYGKSKISVIDKSDRLSDEQIQFVREAIMLHEDQLKEDPIIIKWINFIKSEAKLEVYKNIDNKKSVTN
ncbi:helix-turn-helix domain-containing protein [Tenacibaculum aiptasiae]|uniref:helix-turn-helix domain-containing protein n=1 Tax=Tenacibaculum aiptasiae TaxID=426481 RepID=UPI00232D8B61|nr:helix-turn-helix transcriptional regulator [Tenacibaculum aiptasiae]